MAAERYNFYQCRQKENEPITEFVARLRKAAQTCLFDSLKTCSDPTEEMVLMGFVAGINDKAVACHRKNELFSADCFHGTGYCAKSGASSVLHIIES